MNYYDDMIAVLRLEPGVWPRIGQSRRALHYTVANVLVLGLIYGFSVLIFGRRLLDPGATFNPLLIMMVGVSVAFLVHGGAALYIWMFCRGIGGTTAFFPFYLHVGVAAIGFWFAAPALALAQTGARGGLPGRQHFIRLGGSFPGRAPGGGLVQPADGHCRGIDPRFRGMLVVSVGFLE